MPKGSVMKSLPTTFGLLHLPTKRFARFDDVARSVFHRLKPDLTQILYLNEENELDDRARFYEADELSTVIEILEAEFEDGIARIDDGYDDLVILDNLSAFSPVAFIRHASRLHGTGDYVTESLTFKLVVDIDDLGEAYGLADIPA
jgi:hypothetical protein